MTIKFLNNIDIYSLKTLNNFKALCITITFILVSILGITHHELWLDESHHFLLGRDSTSFLDLYKNSRYDGHPIIWNYLIHLVTRFTNNPYYMQLLHVFISAIAVFVFLKKAPFSLWFKLCFLLSYFMLYEYTIISRNYNLGILFLFLSCSEYLNRNKNFTLLCIYISLCCNTHSIFIIIVLSMAFILFLEQIKNLTLSTIIITYWKGYLILFIGVFLSYVQIIPKSDSTFFNQIDYSNTYEIYKSSISLFKALFPIVDFSQTKYWNTFYFLEHFKILSLVLSLVLWLLPLFLFNNKKTTLIYVYTIFLGFLLFEIIIRRYGIRYNGILFLAIVSGLWISYSQKKEALIERNLSKYNSVVLAFLLFIQSTGGVLAYSLDIKKTFNHGKTVTDYINISKIPLQQIITYCESASLSVYLQENLHHICYNKKQGFYLWNFNYSDFYILDDKNLIELAFQEKSELDKLFFIVAKPLSSETTFTLNKISYTVKLIKAFSGSVTQNYYLYIIHKFEK